MLHKQDQATAVYVHLTRLPLELYNLVLSNLSNRERKCLRLVCSSLRDKTPLRITRVFLSANERNVDVFRSIADHDMYRAQITDLIWDDAVLSSHGDGAEHDQFAEFDEHDPRYNPDTFYERHGLTDREAAPIWFVRGCHENLSAICGRQSEDFGPPRHRDRDQQAEEQLPFPVSYAYYQGLLSQQARVLATEADVEALVYGLARFPALRRITITPAAHGLLYEPLYETAMIRAFPRGFNYPLPRGWAMGRWGVSTPVKPPPWDEAHKAPWRGVSAVLRALAGDPGHRVSELLLDVHGLPTGLNGQLFEDPTCEEYRNLAALVRRPGFRRIELTFLVAWEQWADRPPFRSGHVRRLFDGAAELEHVCLSTDLTPNQEFGLWGAVDVAPEDELRLYDLFPVENFPKLRHFELAGFYLRQSTLLPLLAAMPPSLRSLDLRNLRFYGDGSYRGLLCDMREKLGWDQRLVDERPRVTIAVGERDGPYIGTERVVCVKDEVGLFLYSDGPNPFGREPDMCPNDIQWGMGVVRDEFDPSFGRPWGVWP